MDQENVKIVNFFMWCPRCIHFEKKEDEDPCYDCLAIGARENTTKPEFYIEKE